MHFLADVYVPCDVCRGQRYNRETLEITFRGKNIHEVLQMTVADALRFFQAIPAVAGKLQTLVDVGLSYLHLGQNATTLSGGEAQRVKLARELAKRATGRTLYILDEPTTGLHFHDVAQLLEVLLRLRDAGNTILVIEHNLDVIKSADWVIDLGPEGGADGGHVVAVSYTHLDVYKRQDRRNAYYFQLIQSLARQYGFDIETPWVELPQQIQDVLLHGSGEQIIEFRYAEGSGRAHKRRHRFEGILPNLERRYRETASPTVREELAKYLGCLLYTSRCV